MLASNRGKKVVPPIVAPNELYTSLTVGTLPPFPLTPQTKEVQMNNAGDDNLGNSNVAVTTIPIQIVKILKFYKLNLYYGN